LASAARGENTRELASAPLPKLSAAELAGLKTQDFFL